MPKITNKSEHQKVAEQEVKDFHDDLGPFVVAAESTRMAMVFTNAKEAGHPIIFANDSVLSLTGYQGGLPHELEGKVRLDYRKDGVVCTIDIPASQGMRHG